MRNNIKVIIASCILQMKQSFSRSMFKFCIIAYPILAAITFYFIYMGETDENIISYVFLGTAITSMWSSISFSSAGDIDRERFMGALEVIFCAPTKFRIIMLGKVIGNTILGVCSMVVSFLVVTLLFKTKFTIEHPILFSISMLVGIVSFIFIAMLLSGLLAISRNTRVLMNCIDYPVFILCGAFFPIEVLPIWIRPLAYVLSPTYVLKLARMSIAGIDLYSNYNKHFGGLIIVTVIYIFGYLKFYNIIDIKARKEATLEVI
ncbi:ABC transporter permease [Alkaliphilus peptidifermentans]|uniref:ABC-2 type transport system permease protein n=1 Tax=Alkaliphilus peptidifermentans DSM 18978 TaxID=1120976 RepID=A0A1G5HAE4_9FIRM|nr:ABC transporter permease [Alkaliphilus peptidifermentans]SCY60746.1 ABC-2 type transport system permease protein [Alkaliphilus peptidifermentans DSM 18978]